MTTNPEVTHCRIFPITPCPFCGCAITIEKRVYKNGDTYFEPSGWHDDTCPLDHVLWHMPADEGWTADKVAETWNGRWEDA